MSVTLVARAQPDPHWLVHDIARPRPLVVDPGTPNTPERAGKPPSDAVVLFDGTSLAAWCGLDGSPPKWVIRDSALECVESSGYVRTLQNFGDCQVHVEWAAPIPAKGQGQGRGNSGVFLMGLYEVQVLDSWQNATYADGQAGAVYGQYPPLVNAARPPGEWQTYDILFTRPRFNDRGEVASPARLTVLHNGVLVQHDVSPIGPTGWLKREPYAPHPDKLPLALQDHGNPVRYRNVWVRELGRDAARKEFTFAKADLDRCVGAYRAADDLRIRVSRPDAQLLATISYPGRSMEFPLFAESRTKFFLKTVDAEFLFRTNATGAVEGLTFHIGGEDRVMTRQE